MPLKFENKKHPLARRAVFIRRMLWYATFGLFFILFSLLAGAIGYMYFADLNFIDGLYNAAMILTGMGPVAVLQTDAAKLFATIYSIYSGVAFLTSVGVILAPAVHRLFHILHLDIEEI